MILVMIPVITKNITSINIPNGFQNSASQANSYALNHYALAISGRLCGIDSQLNNNEKSAFLKLFPFFSPEHLSMLKETSADDSSVYIHCKRFCKFTNEDNVISARLYGRLFRLAGCDGGLNSIEISFLEKVVTMLGLPKEYLEKALEYYFLNEVKAKKTFNTKDELRHYIRQTAAKLHPDKFSMTDVLSNRIKHKVVYLANERIKILNENYSKPVTKLFRSN